MPNARRSRAILPEHEKLGMILRRLRERAGYTQKQVAGWHGLSQTFVTKVEAGERRFDLIEFLEYVHLLGGDAHEVIDEIGWEGPPVEHIRTPKGKPRRSRWMRGDND